MMCSVQCLMCIMKFTGADSGSFSGAGAGAVCNVLCAVCRVQYAASQWVLTKSIGHIFQEK